MQTPMMTEKEEQLRRQCEMRKSLEKFERSKILQVYFSRVDGRLPETIPSEYQELYTIDLGVIKSFLLNQHPQDSILHHIFKMMN